MQSMPQPFGSARMRTVPWPSPSSKRTRPAFAGGGAFGGVPAPRASGTNAAHDQRMNDMLDRRSLVVVGASRSLPIYGGFDAGSRPAFRNDVLDAFQRNIDPVTIVAQVAQGIDAVVA